MSDALTQTSDASTRRPTNEDASCLALVIVHFESAERIGEVFFAPPIHATATLGRGEGPHHLVPFAQRPGVTTRCPPLESPFLSREQLRVERVSEAGLRIVNIGKCRLENASGVEQQRLDVSPGEVFALGDHLVLMCVTRPKELLPLRAAPPATFAFGGADEAGLVGESPAAWALRDTLAFVGGRSAHVLVLGPSGSGKELGAETIHRSSARRSRPIVARNASTLPSGIIEAELFGNAASYPNPGMPERSGLIGEANGSTLFLDEIGELPADLSTRLLRFLDDDGDYQRLGDSRRRRADVRVIGATNRPITDLRADLAARFKLRVTMPALDSHREDIPLIARHLMQRIGASDAEVARRFFEGGVADGKKLRIAAELVIRLVLHSYTTHVRELDALLWLALSTSKGDMLALTPEVLAELPATSVQELTADVVRAAIERAGGVHEKAWRNLGLANRHVLKRLVKKYGLKSGDGDPET